MTSRFAFIFAISFSILFGVDKPKDIDLPPQTVTEIQFDSELFQQNHLVKKGMSERDKKALARMGISQMRKNNIAKQLPRSSLILNYFSKIIWLRKG